MLVIPKQNHIFEFQANDMTLTLYGNQFRTRPADRISKKFKSKSTIDL